jgi:hypothetical protein
MNSIKFIQENDFVKRIKLIIYNIKAQLLYRILQNSRLKKVR